MAEEGEASVSRKKTRITPPPSPQFPPSSLPPQGRGSNGSIDDTDSLILEESQGNGSVGAVFAGEDEEVPMDTSTGVDEQVSLEPAPASAVVANVTVTDADALQCGVCFLPLRPPIFQVRRRSPLPRLFSKQKALIISPPT